MVQLPAQMKGVLNKSLIVSVVNYFIIYECIHIGPDGQGPLLIRLSVSVVTVFDY